MNIAIISVSLSKASTPPPGLERTLSTVKKTAESEEVSSFSLMGVWTDIIIELQAAAASRKNTTTMSECYYRNKLPCEHIHKPQRTRSFFFNGMYYVN